MIIGPNGTGKSTVVCAICLGLGGKPSILGRATMESEFIQNGAESATIKIELQGFPGEGSIVIGRVIEKQSSSWYVNKRPSNRKAVQQIVERFNIQMDNLCQFLPQDKVSKFAELPPHELLIETERAVGSKGMVETHEKLIRLDVERSELVDNFERNKAKLEMLQKQQEQDKQLVESINQLQELKKKIAFLQIAEKFIKYKKKRFQLSIYKDEYAKLEQQRRRHQESLKHYTYQAKVCAENVMDQKLASEKTQKDIKQVSHALNKRIKEFETSVEVLNNDQLEIRSIVTSQKLEKKNERDLELKLEQVNSTLGGMEDIDISRVREARSQYTQVRDRVDEIKEVEGAELMSKKSSIEEKDRSLKERKRLILSKLERLNSVFDKKMEALNRMGDKLSIQTAKTIQFLKSNKDQFEHEVLLPPIISVNVDPRYIPQVSANIPRAAMYTFTCQSRSDFKKFTSLVIDNQHLNVYVTEYSQTQLLSPADHPQPCPPEELSNYEFEGYVLDLLEGPSAVLNMLCHRAGVASIPFSRGVLSPEARQRIMGVVNNRGEPVFRKFVDQQTQTSLTRSRFGQRIMSSRTSQLQQRPPVYFFSSKADDSEIEEYKIQLKQTNEEMAGLQQQIEEMRETLGQYEDKVNGYRREQDELRREYERLREILNRKEKYLDRRDRTQRELDELRSNMVDYLELMAEAEATVKMHMATVLSKSKKVLELTERQTKLQREYQDQELRRRSWETDAKVYKRLGSQDIEELEQQIQELKERIQEIRSELDREKPELKKDRKSLTEEQRDLFDAEYSSEDVTVEDVQNERTSLEATVQQRERSTNRSTIERYKLRAEEIKQLSEKVGSDGSSRDTIQARIDELRGPWEAELREIVSQVSREFTNAFELIKCRGEVRLGNTDKSYKEWTVDIMVSFRDNTELQALNHQRQSGGERSVSTIFYLISLQGLTKSPFRVVDEINQGMDQKNERVVHGRMVDVACQANSSQYFLITPKLLTDLEYHPKMKVHCIYSGSFVRDVEELDDSGFNMRELVATARRLREQAE